MDLINEFMNYAGTEAGERAIGVALAVLGAIGAFLLWVFGVFGKIWKSLFGKKEEQPKPTPTYQMKDQAQTGFAEATSGFATGQNYGTQTIHQGAPAGSITLTGEQFVEFLERERAKALADVEPGDDANNPALAARVAEIEAQIANPEPALAVAQERIRDLEARLSRMGNDIGADRLDEARAALAKLDYSVADKIFAEVEARQEIEVQRAARAAYGRGEVAEAEVRWPDAAEHYAKAARLDPSYDTLYKAGFLLWQAGRYDEAIACGHTLVDLSRRENGNRSNETGVALSVLAVNLQNAGRFEEAEPLFRETLDIGRETLGDRDPDYAIRLNNLALLLKAAGRYEEAEPLYREALDIGRETIGDRHPDYATRLNNLAGLLENTGQHKEAEPLYREALEIGREALGDRHPEYAVWLNNLAGLLRVTGRHEEAEPLCREALDIGRETIGDRHPYYATRLNNLAGLLEETGRHEEAEPLYREALDISRETLGDRHPDCATSLNDLALLLKETGRYEEAEPLYREALEIVEATLGEAHPSTQTVRQNLERFLTERDGG